MEKNARSLSLNVSHDVMSPVAKGYMVMAVVLLVWSGFALTVRSIGASPLAIADVALIRFAVPAILLTPLLSSHLSTIKKMKGVDILLILLGGVPFLFVASLGAKTAPTAYVGTILAGTPPFFIALLCCVFYRQLISKKRLFTLSLILIGVITMIVGKSDAHSNVILGGIGYLVCGSIIWSVYTIGLKRAGINAIAVAIVLSYLSLAITLGLILSGCVDSNWGEFSLQEALPFVLIQGVGVGFLSTIGFSYAVNHLGSARSSILGSLSPAITAVLAVPIFGESLSLAILCGISLTIVGVILSSRS